MARMRNRVFLGSIFVIVVILTLPARGAGSTYRYFGTRWLPLKPATRHIDLDKAKTGRLAHVAIYIGAQNHALTQWIQGGVFKDSFDGRPQAYIEFKHDKAYSLRFWPVAYGQKVRIVLAKLGSKWQIAVTVGSTLHLSRFNSITNRVTAVATGETLNLAAGAGHIDARFLHS